MIMAFWIKHYDSHAPKQNTWHIPSKKPNIGSNELRVLQADGDEKRLIAARFTNLPITIGDQPCTWRGEMAQFIFENL